MDKVMKRLGIEVATYQGKDVTLVVHCNIKDRVASGGKNSWLIAL
jgi:hypothetical protein